MSLKRKIVNIFAAFMMVLGTMPMPFSSVHAEDNLPQPGEVPASSKTVKINGDGTYDITLTIQGKSKTETSAVDADVVIVYDVSMSMRSDPVYDPTPEQNGIWGYSRDSYKSQSLDDGNFIVLYRKNGNGYMDLHRETTYDGDVYVRMGVNKYVPYTGTRFVKNTTVRRYELAEPALQSLESALEEHDNVTIHRITFGASAREVSSFSYGYNAYTEMATNWDAALDLANEVGNVDGHEKIVIFISDGNPRSRSNSDANNLAIYNNAVAHAQDIVDGGAGFYGIGVFGDVYNMESLVAESGSPVSHYYLANNESQLRAALEEILAEIVHKITVTALTITDGITAATATEVSGTAGHFRYDVSKTSWSDNFTEAQYVVDENGNGSVVWEPGPDCVLSTGQEASLTFTVWPSQEAMDCIAKIKNGQTCDKNLAEYGLKQNGDDFELITNTSAYFTYKTRTETDGVVVDSVESEAQPIPENEYNAVLPETKLKVTKAWDDGLDPKQRKDIGEISVDFLVDGELVNTYVFNQSSEDGNEWTGASEDEEYEYAVAPGVMKKLTGLSYDEAASLRAVALAAGEDRIVMVGDDEYAILEIGHDYEFDNETYTLNQGGTNHYHITKRTYHPMITKDGQIYDVEFDWENHTATISSVAMTSISVENTINGGILVSKVVNNNGSVDEDIDDEYEITIYDIKDKNGNLLSNTAETPRLFRIQTCEKVEENGETVEKCTSGAKTPYENGKIEATIKVNQRIMVTDVPTGTTYKVKEDVPDGYTRNKITYQRVQYSTTGTQTIAEEPDEVHKVNGNASSQAIVTNYLESGNLKISKEVVAAAGTDEAQAKDSENKFDFTLNFYEDEDDETPIRTEDAFSLAHGETITFNDIPADWYYEIVEAPKDGFNEGASTTKTGVIKKGETVEETFTNNYAFADDLDVEIEVIKSFVSGREGFWLDDEFTFELTGNGEVQTKTVTKNDNQSTFVVTLTKAGTFVYTITELTEDEDGNSLFRTGISRLEGDLDVVATVVTEDDGHGNLVLKSVTYANDKQQIFNTYEETSVLGLNGELVFKKKLKGRDWIKDFDAYNITIENADGKLPEVTTLTAKRGDAEIEDGTVVVDFGTIEFNEEDVGNTYNYIVTESFDKIAIPGVEPTEAAVQGITFNVKVVYNENNDKKISLQVSQHDDTFVNVYTSEDITTDESELTEDLFTIYKVVEDESGKFEGEEFKFTVESDDFETKNVSIETATEGDDEIDGPYTFTEAGTYTFTVTEIAGNTEDMEYDDTVYTVEIEVVDNQKEGRLEIVSAKINGEDASDTNKLEFTNVYTWTDPCESDDGCGGGGDIPLAPETGIIVQKTGNDKSDEMINMLIGKGAMTLVAALLLVFANRKIATRKI